MFLAANKVKYTTFCSLTFSFFKLSYHVTCERMQMMRIYMYIYAYRLTQTNVQPTWNNNATCDLQCEERPLFTLGTPTTLLLRHVMMCKTEITQLHFFISFSSGFKLQPEM